MPYIARIVRPNFDKHGLDKLCKQIQDRGGVHAGDLAYIAYRLLLTAAPHGSNFAQRNAMMGALNEAVAEYRRRVHEPAEDDAREKNGDVK